METNNTNAKNAMQKRIRLSKEKPKKHRIKRRTKTNEKIEWKRKDQTQNSDDSIE